MAAYAAASKVDSFAEMPALNLGLWEVQNGMIVFSEKS